MKKFIIINKKRVFISRKKYNLLKIIDNRYYYAKKLDQKNKLIHFSSYDTESFNAVNQVRDTRSLPSQLYETKEIYNALYRAINKLDKNEKVIILGIYFKNYSLRKLAIIRHTNAMAISRQRDKILKKLRKDLIKFDNYY